MASHRIDEHLEIGYNLGYSYFGFEKGDIIYSLSLGKGLGKKAGVYIESYGQITNVNQEVITNIDTGFTHLIAENF